MTENVVDMTTRKSVKPEMPEDATLSRWFDIWKKYAKDNKVQTLMLVGVDKDGAIYNDVFGLNEVHLLRLYRECDNMKLYIDAIIDPDVEDDDESDET